MAQSNLKQSPNQTFGGGASHLRSLSQPTFIANNCLPPLSPVPPSESLLASSNSNLKNMSLEEIDVTSRGSTMGIRSPRDTLFCGNGGLPPRRAHCRSSSDVPLGFSAMIQSSPQLVPISTQGILGQTASAREKLGNKIPLRVTKIEVDMVGYRKKSGGEAGERKLEGEVVDNFFASLMDLDHVDNLNSCGANSKDKDTIVGENESAALHLRHYRSLSMDSGIGNFQGSSPNLQTSFYNRVDQLSPSNSLSENSTNVTLDFGQGEFNVVELEKIKADGRLAEIAMSDPKRAKRILANRQSAARSKERKLRYITELEHKVQTLQTETTTLSTQITILQNDHAQLTNQNNELKFRIHAMEKQAQLNDALHETLTAEVQCFMFANMEFGEEGRNSSIAQQVSKHNMFPTQGQHPNQGQCISVTASSTLSTTSAAPASA